MNGAYLLPNRSDVGTRWGSAKDTLTRLLVAPFVWSSDLPKLALRNAPPLSFDDDPDEGHTVELVGYLGPFRSRLAFFRSVMILIRTLLILALFYLAARIAIEWGAWTPPSWAFLIAVVVACWGAWVIGRQRVTYFEVARIVDRELGLKAQIATAVELSLRRKGLGPLDRTQVRAATNAIRDIEPSFVIAFKWPTGDLRVLAVTLALIVATNQLASIRSRLVAPVDPLQAEIAQQAAKAAQSGANVVTVDATQSTLQNSPTDASLAAADQLVNLKQQLDSKAISESEYQQQLASVEQQLQQQAVSSADAQVALAQLASALSDTSATHSISASIQQGNFADAAAQMNDLSQHVGNLSPQALQGLANSLRQAAKNSPQGSALSQSASQAADALESGNAQQASDSLKNLASAVDQASKTITSQADLGQALSDVQSQLGRPGALNDPSQGDPSQGGANGADQDLARMLDQGTGAQTAQAGDPSASSSGDSTADQRGTQAGAQGADAASSGTTDPGASDPTGSGQGTGKDDAAAGGTGGSAGGNGPGSATYGSQFNLPGVTGKPLLIKGEASHPDNGPRTGGDRNLPLTNNATGSETAQPSASGLPSDQVVNAHGEANVVPIDLKQIVRSYFSSPDAKSDTTSAGK